MKTAQTIEERSSLKAEKMKNRRGDRRGMHGKHNTKYLHPYPKGVSGNPGGKPGTDVAARIARNVMELNEAQVYEGMAKEVLDGKPYAFDVLAKRAYGAVKERVEVTGADGEPLNIKITVVQSGA
jgi:hypothetical protein